MVSAKLKLIITSGYNKTVTKCTNISCTILGSNKKCILRVCELSARIKISFLQKKFYFGKFFFAFSKFIKEN